MFIRDPSGKEDLLRIRAGEASVEDMDKWVRWAPEEILRSPSLAALSLEDPGAWLSILPKALEEFSKNEWLRQTSSLLGHTAQDFIVQSRALWRAAKIEFGQEEAKTVMDHIQDVFVADDYPKTFRDKLESITYSMSFMVPYTRCYAAERIAIVRRLKKQEIPPELKGHVHVWKEESWA